MSKLSAAATPRQPRVIARRRKAWEGRDKRVRLADARYARAEDAVNKAYEREGFGGDYMKAVRARQPHVYKSVAAWRRANR
jgi:hypothetical protein